MIFKLCRKCNKPIEHPNKYCSDCLKIVEEYQAKLLRDRENKYNKNRDPKYKTFYNSKEWKMLKDKKMLDEEYRCERCHKLATEVHHIKPIQTDKGWELRLDYNNLLCVCIDCHNKEHGRFQKRKVVR